MRFHSFVATAMIILMGQNVFGATIGGCKFDKNTLRFQGDISQQTRCLLRKVNQQGSGAKEQPIPDWLTSHVGRQISISEPRLLKYLSSHGIDPADVGGALDKGSADKVRFFVIHDTSTPEFAESVGFPADMDDPGHAMNDLSKWNGKYRNKVNIIVSRDGKSRTYHAWGTTRPESGIKLEMAIYASAARPMFVHVENIQPRLKPKKKWAWIAPKPGFSAKQEDRLALAYVLASFQAGRWLVPAYHFNIDEGLPDGHDDPQYVDLQSWVKRVEALDDVVKE